MKMKKVITTIGKLYLADVIAEQVLIGINTTMNAAAKSEYNSFEDAFNWKMNQVKDGLIWVGRIIKFGSDCIVEKVKKS